jgi:NAD(P)-dependent dehydrogenase (short-subunit alcohol dehydrogenase family)
VKKDDIEACLRVLQALADDRTQLAELEDHTRHQLLMAAGRVSRPTRDEQRQLHRAFRRRDRKEQKQHDAALLARAVNRAARRSSGFVLPASTAPTSADAPTPEPPAEELLQARNCYVCKAEFRRVHHFYDQLCLPCAELNWQKRHQTADLRGRTALVTGARIKIGYQAALILLRAGASVHATTRFPVDAAERFAREPDFAGFRDRLTLHGIDLRHVPSVEKLAQHLDETLPSLDFLINNAAQTVRRPAAYYRTLVEREERPLHTLPEGARALLAGPAGETRLVHFHAQEVTPARLTQLALTEEDIREVEAFPPDLRDLDDQQADLRTMNSWRLTADRVSTVELLEVHLVNAVAPFLLVSRLRSLMRRRPERDKHIVNVSAMEAQFARNKKTDKHPHTNMAKAALNMLTRTSAVDYERDGIFMNSVDTGWITDEDPLVHVARKQVEHDFHPPLDAIDGAARVLDPIFLGHTTGEHPWGHFWKDYRTVGW